MTAAPTGERYRVLVVDDSTDTLERVRRSLSRADYDVFLGRGVQEALELLEREAVDIVLTDLKMPRIGGLELVRYVRENLPDAEVILMTGYPSVGGAVEAMKTGAEDYLAKPFTEDELLDCLSRARQKLELRRAGRHPDTTVAPAGFLGESEPMRRVYRAIARAAATDATILITGESGTGKELVARAIHYQSGRSASPFVPINCGGIPEGLLESELFGHVRGSFTGATATRAGFFQTAEGGTIFLDEVGELPLSMQARLLRALQDGEVTMVGSSRPRSVDVRIVAATNKDLAAAVRSGAFREDLYFRINVLAVELPPLRERGDDVLLLAEHFATRYASTAAGQPAEYSPAALEALRSWPWPGNVRELENTVQRAVVMGEGERIEVADLPAPMRHAVPRAETGLRTLAEVEADHILAVCAAVGGNKTRASEILGIDRKTLRQKLKALDGERPGQDAPVG